MDIETSMRQTKLDLYKKRFQNELEHLNIIKDNNNTTSNEEEYQFIIDRIEALKKIIDSINYDDINKSKVTGFNISAIEKYLYRKPWKRLQPYHQLTKIKEFIKENYSKDDQFKLINMFTPLIYQKKLGRKGQVDYDPNQEKIISIPCLIINDDDEYEIRSK
jgi:hypothetical protein